MPISRQSREVIALLERSPDHGDGWRQVAPKIWDALIANFEPAELLERDDPNRRVRLSVIGSIVAKYL